MTTYVYACELERGDTILAGQTFPELGETVRDARVLSRPAESTYFYSDREHVTVRVQQPRGVTVLTLPRDRPIHVA